MATMTTSVSSPEIKGAKLTQMSYDSIMEVSANELFYLSQAAGIQDDERLSNLEDLRVRLILIKRKMEGSSNTWKHLFKSVKEETTVKIDSLHEIMKTVESIFQTIPTDSLSEVLREEGHLQSPNLLEEIAQRMKNLKERRSLVIIAGETNGGKSTFLNLLLGEEILPTDVLHCTFSVCKIVYSESYSIKTIDHNDREEVFPCSTREEVKHILRNKVSQQEMKERVHGPAIKEIILSMPADILKSGVTLVDTPGIGEDENMDNVTMNFVKSTHASAFIYIIKSDTAGGVQEDRLLNFLRAIKERYSSDKMVEAFDPRAAMFVCHRWDNIKDEQKEKVKKNALSKLEYVWPGFEPSQTYFFSSTDAMKHLPVDPEFVTDSFMHLLKGIKDLFDLASHNAIKHQYIWLKYMLQPASRHLRSMITHCIHSGEELEKYFKNVAVKQSKLMVSSELNSLKLQKELDMLTHGLKTTICNNLNFDSISPLMEINNATDIIETCSKENFFTNRENRRLLDDMIIRSLIKYVDEHIHERKIVQEMESTILTAIQEHLGLFSSQISQIKHDMLHGGTQMLKPSPSRTSLNVDDDSIILGSSTTSIMSNESNRSSVESFTEEMTLNPSQLANTINNMLQKRKTGRTRSSINNKHEIQESLLSKVKGKIMFGILHKAEPRMYVEERIRKVAKYIREDKEAIDNILHGYIDWIQHCVNYATQSIPKFIDVNNKLMDEIREHRGVFQRNKDLFLKVMENLEPNRHQMRGYGLLYMDDFNAEMLVFNVEHRDSSVIVPKDLIGDHKINDDSGFQGSGSKNRKVQSLWGKMQGATIKINNLAERVVVKTYTYDMDEKVILSEIASLRCLECTNLAQFVGMTRVPTTDAKGDGTFSASGGPELSTEKVSAFIFKGDLISARVHSTRKMVNMQLFVPEMLDSLLKGLNFLHREGLVHMELNLDTVMVERVSGTVQLCQMCKPREARFPTCLNTITKSCVCLSPSVLQGHIYEITDDIYAFGLLLWEILFPDEPPYKEQRFWTLKKFIEECHPNNMLQESLMNLHVSENVREVLKGTLLVTRGLVCMPISMVQSCLADISEEPAVRRMRSRPGPAYVEKPKPDPEILARKKQVNFNSLSEISPKFASNESTPTRPPRPKHELKSASVDEPVKISCVPNKERRVSEPAVSPYTPNSPLIKHKKRKSIISIIFPRGSTKNAVDEESDDSASRSSSPIPEKESSQVEISTASDISTAQVKLEFPPNIGVRKDNPLESRPRPRRSSYQDQSLFGLRTVNLKRTESIDVPSLMFKNYSSSLGKSLPKEKNTAAKPMVNLIPTSKIGSMPSLVHQDVSAGNSMSGSNYVRSNVKSRLSAPKFLQASTSPIESSLQDIKWLDHKQRVNLSQRLGGSLQDLSDGSVDHVNHAIGPIMEDKVEASSQLSQSTDSPFRESSEYFIMSTPATVIHSLKTLPKFSLDAGNIGYMQGDFSSSSNYSFHSVDTNKILAEDSHDRGLQSLNGIKTGCSPEAQTDFGFRNGNVNSKYNKVILRSRSAPANHFEKNFKSLGIYRSSQFSSGTGASNSDIQTDKGEYKSEEIQYYSSGSVEANSENIQVCNDQQQSNVPFSVPAPPPINFSKLTFGSRDFDDDSDDEGFPTD